MKVNVEKISKWKRSRSGYENCLVVCRGLDDGKYYNLNVNTEWPQHVGRWLPYIQEGRVLDVGIRTDNGKVHVDFFGHFTPGKPVSGKEATHPDGSLPHQVRLV